MRKETGSRALVVLVVVLAVAGPMVGAVGATDDRSTDATSSVDLSLSLEGGTTAPGETVTVTFTVSNDGSSAASGVSVQARFPKTWAVQSHEDDGGQFARRGVGWQFT